MTNERNLKRIKSYFHKWEWIVTRYGWHFTILYRDGFDEMPHGTVLPNTAMLTTSNFNYLQGVINVNLKVCFNEDDDDVEEMCVHELTHMLLSPFSGEDNERDKEYVCTTISRVIKLISAHPKVKP
jgi:hypothetical protein